MTTETAPCRRASIGRSMLWIAILAVLIAPILWWVRDSRIMQMRVDVARQASLADRARAEAELNMARATMAIRNTIGDAASESDRAELERLRAENRDLKKRLAEAR